MADRVCTDKDQIKKLIKIEGIDIILFSDHVLQNSGAGAEKFSYLCIALQKMIIVLCNSNEW